jgi:putative tricarboxylic transport membrane protein
VDIISAYGYGLQIATAPENLAFCFVGALIGTLVGVLPGLGPGAAMALLLPLTYHLPPVSAMIMLAGIYNGAMFGGSTTSILVKIPGEAGSIMTCIDGYEMAKQGRAGPALAIAAIGSFFGGSITTFIITVVAVPLSRVALEFGPSEYFALMCAGILLLCFLSQDAFLKSLISAVVGLLLGTVGMDIFTGQPRFTLGIPSLYEGIELVAVLMGMYGLAELLNNLDELYVRKSVLAKDIGRLMPSREDFRRSIGPILRGSMLGTFFGVLPGGGTILSTFSSYTIEKKLSKEPQRFGRGAIEGVAGPETANNSSSTGGFIPVLTLGLPTNSTVALLIAALMILGVQPGPLLITDHPDIFWGVIMSLFLANVVLVVLNLPLVGVWVQVLKIPYIVLFPLILLFCVIGAYSVSNSMADVYIMMCFGVLGYLMNKGGFPTHPLVLAMIMEPMLETSFRQALSISGGNFGVFVSSPISIGLLTIVAVVILASTLKPIRRVLGAALVRNG